MKISDILSPSNIYSDLQAENKRAVLRELSAKAAMAAGVDERLCVDAVLERENLGATAYGAGTAFPHARIEGLNKVVAVFARLAKPLDFDALDQKPVDLIFMLISPENSGADHLTALAMFSRFLKNEDICSKLRHAKSKEEIYSILSNN